MPLTFGGMSAHDKLSRCKEEAASLDQEVNTEGLRRFAGHAWHLCDWIMKDPTIPAAAKDEVSAWRNSPPIPELSACKDITNSDKHMQITRYTPATDDASSQRGYGVGRYGKGGFGVGEETISVTMKDGRVFDALEIVRAVIIFWDDFFYRHGISGQPHIQPGNFRDG
jgi:hypothetical protein